VWWGIGDGASTKILHDRWIPGIPPCLVKPLVPLSDGQTVASLIVSRSWNEDAVRAIFVEDIVNKVLQIPISRSGGNDFVTWPHNKLGIYIVRSAYYFARKDLALISQSGRGHGMFSGSGDDAMNWKALWAIRAPGKMKITLWRFAHDCLPSGHQLQHRHIPASPNCIHCSAEERVEHAMLFCPFAREVWIAVKENVNIELNRKGFINPKQWLFDFLKRCNDQQATTLAVTFWHLWDTRNRLREDGANVHPSSVAVKIKIYVDMIVTHLYKLGANPRREPTPAIPWAPPPEGYLMINVDAALFASSECMGAGVVIRDCHGVCVVARREKLANVIVPELAEAMAVRVALIFAQEEGLNNFIIATDCLSVVQRVCSRARDRSAFAPVIEDIKDMVEAFDSCSIIHISRVQNVAAHCLARSCEFLPNSVWRGVPPDCIRETICIESLFD
jgi:hypothetical protein